MLKFEVNMLISSYLEVSSIQLSFQHFQKTSTFYGKNDNN